MRTCPQHTAAKHKNQPTSHPLAAGQKAHYFGLAHLLELCRSVVAQLAVAHGHKLHVVHRVYEELIAVEVFVRVFGKVEKGLQDSFGAVGCTVR